jgi:HK97 family phage major capsid protein
VIKNDLETTKFSLGTGTNEPQGILVGATTTVTTVGVGAFAIADLYSLEQAIPAPLRLRSQIIGNRSQFDRVKQFVATGQAIPWVQTRCSIKTPSTPPA